GLESTIDRVARLQRVRQQLKHAAQLLVELSRAPSLQVGHDQRGDEVADRTEDDRSNREAETEEADQGPESDRPDPDQQVLRRGDVQARPREVLAQRRLALHLAALAQVLGRRLEQALDQLA